MLTQSDVAWQVEMLFQDLAMKAAGAGMKDSDLAVLLDRAQWGLGDGYREWCEESGDYE